jgi:hypothetical protein
MCVQFTNRTYQMRYLYALIVSTGLCLVPAIGQAAPAADRTSSSVASVAEASHVTVSNRLARTSVGSTSLAADSAGNNIVGDKARYAEREAQSGKAQDYRGGDTVVIGASAAVVILAIVLVIVLL